MMTLNPLEKLEESTESLLQIYVQLRLDHARLLQNELLLKVECERLREKNTIVLAKLKDLIEQFKSLKRD